MPDVPPINRATGLGGSLAAAFKFLAWVKVTMVVMGNCYGAPSALVL